MQILHCLNSCHNYIEPALYHRHTNSASKQVLKPLHMNPSKKVPNTPPISICYPISTLSRRRNESNTGGIPDITDGGLMSSLRERMSRVREVLTEKLSFLGVSSQIRPATPLSRPVSPNHAASINKEPITPLIEVPSQKRVAFQLPLCGPVEDDTSEDLKIIVCLCTTTNTSTGCRSETCLGVLISSVDNRRYKEWLPGRRWLDFPLEKYTILHSIFSTTMLSPKPTQLTRLKLGVKLASSLMQLHGSMWLEEQWGKRDIYFVKGLAGPLIDKPFLYHIFPTSLKITETAPAE